MLVEFGTKNCCVWSEVAYPDSHSNSVLQSEIIMKSNHKDLFLAEIVTLVLIFSSNGDEDQDSGLT